MGTVVFILGRSGTGKSYSMREFNPDEIAVINIQGKVLPFRNGAKFPVTNTDEPTRVIQALDLAAKKFKTIVIDDFQYLMANEFMRRSTERGYDKFTEIARHAWDVVDKVRELPQDVIVYILCHTDTDNDGVERLKTIGKMLDEKIVLEGMSTIVLKTNVSDGTYTFLTQNNGKDTVKSPAGMFPSYAIDNNLKYVDEKIRNYYGIGEHLTDAEMKEVDETAKVDVVKEPGTRRRRRTAETAENTPETAQTTTDDTERLKEIEELTNARMDAVKGIENLKRRSRAETAAMLEKASAPVEETPVRRRRRAETADVTPAVDETPEPERRKRLTRGERSVELPFDIPDTELPEPDTTGDFAELLPDPTEEVEATPRRRGRRTSEE